MKAYFLIQEELEYMDNNLDIFKTKAYITTGRIAQILNLTDYTVRYYADEFNQFLKIPKVNSRRYYSVEHVERFTYIIYLLKEKKLPIKMAIEYLNTEDGINMKPFENLIETPFFLMLRQVGNGLYQLANTQNEVLNKGIIAKTEVTEIEISDQETNKILLEQFTYEQKFMDKVDLDKTFKQIDFQITNLKSCISQYEILKEERLYEELESVLSSLISSIDKIKLISVNMPKMM